MENDGNLTVSDEALEDFGDREYILIEKPQWQGWNADGTAFVKAAAETLTPDLINIYEEDGAYLMPSIIASSSKAASR